MWKGPNTPPIMPGRASSVVGFRKNFKACLRIDCTWSIQRRHIKFSLKKRKEKEHHYFWKFFSYAQIRELEKAQNFVNDEYEKAAFFFFFFSLYGASAQPHSLLDNSEPRKYWERSPDINCLLAISSSGPHYFSCKRTQLVFRNLFLLVWKGLLRKRNLLLVNCKVILR